MLIITLLSLVNIFDIISILPIFVHCLLYSTPNLITLSRQTGNIYAVDFGAFLGFEVNVPSDHSGNTHINGMINGKLVSVFKFNPLTHSIDILLSAIKKAQLQCLLRQTATFIMFISAYWSVSR
jgi:hypothetical protein